MYYAVNSQLNVTVKFWKSGHLLLLTHTEVLRVLWYARLYKGLHSKNRKNFIFKNKYDL